MRRCCGVISGVGRGCSGAGVARATAVIGTATATGAVGNASGAGRLDVGGSRAKLAEVVVCALTPGDAFATVDAFAVLLLALAAGIGNAKAPPPLLVGKPAQGTRALGVGSAVAKIISLDCAMRRGASFGRSRGAVGAAGDLAVGKKSVTAGG